MAAGTRTFDHTIWNTLLEEGTQQGLVDYIFFEQERAKLDQYLAELAEAELKELDRDQLMALLINAYNAYTVQSILDFMPLESIKEIPGVWDTREHTVGGHQLTLDGIEHNILRPLFKDPRIHFAVNCASMSCAPLPPWAFTGEELEQQLSQWTQQFVNDPKYVRFEDQKVVISKLLNWYGSDFTLPDAFPRAESVRSFLAQSAKEPLRSQLLDPSFPTQFDEYDWSLNQAAR